MIYPSSQKLLPFQEDCVKQMLHFLRENEGCYNACEMGLGKSIQAIVACNTFFKNSVPSILIVCPAVMRLVWKDEAQKWFKVKNSISVFKSAKELTPDFCYITIVSYELASSDKFIKFISNDRLDVLILDESHYLKSPKAKRTKQILKHIWPLARYKICLSGTPFTQNVIDGYTLFNKLAPYEFPDFWSFAHTFAYRKNNGFGIRWEGLKNADKLKQIIYSKFFVRKLKSQVLTELPPKVYQKVTLDKSYAYNLTKDEQAAQDAYYAELKALLGKDIKVQLPPPPVSIMTVRREQGLKKVPAVIEFVRNLLEQNVPVVLFAIFRECIKQYEEAFKEYKPAVIHGGTPPDVRKSCIESFQRGSRSLFIGQITAAGTGITLTASSTVVFSELSYSPSEVAQASDRVHRVGQKDSVTIYYFTVEDSVDEKIIEIIMRKAREFNTILN